VNVFQHVTTADQGWSAGSLCGLHVLVPGSVLCVLPGVQGTSRWDRYSEVV